MGRQTNQEIGTRNSMAVQTPSLRFAVVLVIIVLGSVIGCARTMPVPAAIKPIDNSRIEAPTFAPPTASSTPTRTTPTSIAMLPAAAATATPEPSPTPTETPTPTPTRRPGLPVQLRIPAIGVDAYIEHVGLTEDLAMGVPSKTENVAWYKLGYRPGERGTAVIAGHLDTVTGAPAVFWRLESLEPGDEITVRGLDGIRRRFIVESRARYLYDEAPVQRIFGPAEAPRLALITCQGAWDRANRNYSHRVVVYATAAQEDKSSSNAGPNRRPPDQLQRIGPLSSPD